MLIDSHCHLDFPEFQADFPSVLESADAAGVVIMQTISTSISGFYKVVKAASVASNIYCSLGIHPLHVAEENPINASKLIALTASQKVIGIGETGLDYHYNIATKDLQKSSFIEHIKTCQETGLPLIVHTRDAEADTLEILRSQLGIKPFNAIIHCFTGTKAFAQSCLELGFYISFSGIVTFKNALGLQEVVKIVPLDRMLIETDAPYLAPVPKRGKRNEPAFVQHTAKFIADFKNIPYNEFCERTSENFLKLFNKVKLK